ncbi:MAG: phnE [Caulobacter sp.]|nr:phnE [Caulobacter sp.]
MAEAAVTTPIPPPPRRKLKDQLIDLLVWGGLAAVLLFSFHPVEMEKLAKLGSSGQNIADFTASFFHPNFTDWKLYIQKMWETIQMALWGTALAIILAIPLGLLGAKNVSPVWIQQPVRRMLDVLRSVPDLVVGNLFVAAIGLGPFAGVMAIAINTGGVLGKLFAEAVESIDKGPVEGVRATGAVPIQESVWGIIPQVAPLWTSYALYRFESSSRAATVLGLIGAGGIGQLLFDNLNAFKYANTATIVIIIVVSVSIIDLLSQTIRSRLL